MTSRVIATIFALVSFAAALIVGQQAGNPAVTVLSRALLIMLACYVIGRLIGAIANTTVNDHIERYRADHPMPEGMDELEAQATGTAAPNSQYSTTEPASAG